MTSFVPSPTIDEPRRRAGRLRLVIVIIAVAAAFALPLVPGLGRSGDVVLYTTIVIAAYFATSWNLVGGLAGQLSFAHSIFLAAGAYGSGALFSNLGWHPLVGGAVGIVVAAALGAAIAWLCARYGLAHLAFGLATAAFSMIALFFVKGSEALGGAFGISLPTDADASELYFSDGRNYYWLFLALLLFALVVTLWIRDSRLGTQFIAIRESEAAAAALGIDVMRTKVYAMTISAALMGLGGVFYANYLRFISPESLIGFNRSLLIVIPALLGGTTVILGPLVGAVIYGFVVERSSAVIQIPGGPLIILGVMLSVVILVMPSGILPSLIAVGRRVRAGYRARRRARPDDGPGGSESGDKTAGRKEAVR